VFMHREKFLTAFLGALGAESISFETAEDGLISGTVQFDPSHFHFGVLVDENDYKQDFCWHMSENSVPNEKVFNLAQLIHRNSLLDIDRLTVSPDQLREKYNEEYKKNLDQAEFNNILDELKHVFVKMVNDGKETDTFYIHQ